ncbi:hypothetical protein BDC45DRAFT_438243 [Circinella umbellata]|nr:hypothetical protein BDC45DRAFT_438243 [Circinella umbellata]
MTKAPLTPPPQEEEEAHHHRKPSVTFDLSNLPAPRFEEQETALLSPTRSIDISAQAIPDTICVALLDRDTEMRHLVAHNTPLFNTLRSHLFNDWPRFENTLYVPRQQLDDIEWMARISKALQPVPSLLQQFRDLVGYVAPREQQQQFDHVDITRIRALGQDKLKDFPTHYPQFFINCQNCLLEKKDNNKGYKGFTETLFASSQTIPDDIWEMRIYNQLDPYPDLLAQLKEIIAYETEQHPQE